MADKRPSALSTEITELLDDDFLHSDSATAGSRKIRLARRLAALRNTLAPRGGVAFDGANGNVVGAMQAIGTDPFSDVFTIEVPTSPPTAGEVSWVVAGMSNDSTSLNRASALTYTYESNGTLRAQLRNAANNGGMTLDAMGFVQAYAGKEVQLAFVRPASGNAQWWVNGAQLAATSSTYGTSPGSWQNTLASSFQSFGRYDPNANMFRGKFRSRTIYNLALSASDVQEIYELGGGVPERFKWGSQVARFTSDYSAGANGADVGAGAVTVTGNVDGINGQNDWLSVARITSGALIAHFGSNRLPRLRAVKIAMRIYVDPAITGLTHLTLKQDTGTIFGTFAAAAGQQYDVSFSGITKLGSSVPDRLYLYATDSTGVNTSNVNGAVYVKSVVIIDLGAVIHLPLDDGIGYQLHDESTNNLDAVMTTAGVSHLRPQRRGFVRSTLTWAGTHEAKSLLGQDCLPLGAYLLLATVRPTASTSGGGMLFGTVNDNGRFVAAAVPLTANQKKPISLYTPLPLTGATVGGGHLNLAIDPDNAAYTGSITVETHYALTEGNP